MLRYLEEQQARQELKRQKFRLIAEFRAVGGTTDQLNAIKEIAINNQLSPEGFSYFSSRLIPIVTAAYDVAQYSRRQSLLLDGLELFLPFLGATLALGSSGLFKDYQDLTLFVMGSLSAATAVIHGWEKVSQPALEWYAARVVFSTITREISLWSGRLNGYTNLSESEALVLLQQRCENVMSSTEFSLQDQIRTSINGAAEAQSKEDEKKVEKPKLV